MGYYSGDRRRDKTGQGALVPEGKSLSLHLTDASVLAVSQLHLATMTGARACV